MKALSGRLAIWGAIFFGATLVAPPSVRAISVGPDAFGYVSIDSATSGGPAFEFVDIATTGSRVTFLDPDSLPAEVPNADDGVAIDLPLTSLNEGAGFVFYGNTYTKVHMSTNGFLTFSLNDSSDSFANECPVPVNPVSSVNNAIYVLWDDLVLQNAPSLTSGGYVQNFPVCPFVSGGTSGCVLFQWDSVDHFNGGIDSFDFQVALYEDGTILMNYRGNNPEQGADSTTGIEDESGSDGLTHVCNSGLSVPPNSSILFRLSEPRFSLTKTVGFPSIDPVADNCPTTDTITVTPGATVRYCYTVQNTGVTNINRHDLVDDIEGAILTNFPYILVPGASAFITKTVRVSASNSATATWTGKNAVGVASFATDAAQVIVDADVDGVPDEGDACPFDTAKVSPGQCGCGIIENDKDGDGFLDCIDECDSDNSKSKPGACGCGFSERDLNANLVSDCDVTAELKIQLRSLYNLVSKLKHASYRRRAVRPREVKKALQELLIEVDASSSSLNLKSNTSVSVLRSELEQDVLRTLRITSPNFVDFRREALGAIARFENSLSL